ncbi:MULTISPECIES: hypothetical protein [Streptomyces]|uniref:LLM class F420-dependent oxidoreductase n=1 Tax=Streptomyces bugieae TaxID=3098223 RepID=A0ABU7NR81_9ACTN|nr:hypothetical protein [Streptomyces nigrescens]MEE4421412.1 hypothetical protein [Streptomyces sp. DSM 41528]
MARGDEDAVRRRGRDHLAAGADHVAVQPGAANRGPGPDQLRELAPALIED